MTFLSKGGPDCGTLLLHDGSLIGNCLCGPDVTDELFDCSPVLSALVVVSIDVGDNSREVIVTAETPSGVRINTDYSLVRDAKR